MEIRVADAAGFDFDQDFAGAGPRVNYVLDDERGTGLVKYRSFHHLKVNERWHMVGDRRQTVNGWTYFPSAVSQMPPTLLL
jgi:hypothetical protein